MSKVRYIGGEGTVNRDVGEATGRGDVLEPGAVYDLPAELARSLVASSTAWETVKPRKGSDNGEA